MSIKFLEIWSEELPPEWEWTPKSYLGGTPEFVVNTAEFISHDTEVIVYYDGETKYVNRVYYLPRDRFIGGADVILSCNSKAPKKGKYNIYWSSWFHNRDKDFLDFDERIVLSPYHQKIFGNNSRLIPLSIWPEQFKNPVKVKKQCLYSSSPDRGLNFLKSIWNDVSRETGAVLISTYDYGISEKEMVELYKSSEFWLHPGQGIELFCLSAVKAQAAKCIPVVVPNMALETTVKYGVKTTLEKYKDELIKTINNPPKVEDVNFGSWETVTMELFKNVPGGI